MKKALSCLLTIALLFTVMAPALFLQAQETGVGLYDQVLEKEGFIYGVNLPWITQADDGSTWAANAVTGAPSSFDEDKLEAVLRDIKAIGFTGVRVQLFRGLQGLTLDGDGLVSGLGEDMKANLETLLKTAKKLDLHLAFVLLPGVAEEAYAKGKATYDKLSQIIANPGVYLENVVAPVCEILSAYPEAVLSVDVLSNPEDEIYETGKIYGTTWDVVRNFIKANAEAVKKALPNVPVMASSADRAQAAVKAGLLNNLGLDIVGVTNYSDSGSVTPAKDFRSPSPLWVVDMGVETDDNLLPDFLSQTTQKLYDNAKAGGYRAAFFAQYGDKALGKVSANSLLDENGAMRTACTSIHFQIIDNAVERAETEVEEDNRQDKPAFLNIESTTGIKWFGNRDAVSYKLERSTDGTTWSTVADLDADTVDPASSFLISYSDVSAEVNHFYCYRVTAITLGGGEVVSDPTDPLYVPQLVCDPEDNIIPDYGFESGKLDRDLWYFNDSDQEFWEGGLVTGTPEDGSVHSGTHAYKLHPTMAWNQMFMLFNHAADEENPDGIRLLESGKRYTFTMYYKITDGTALSEKPWIGFMESVDGNWLHPVTGVANEYMTSMIPDGEWHPYTFTFTATSNEYLLVVRNAKGTITTLDDLYLFEAPDIPAAPQMASAKAQIYNALSQEDGNVYDDGGFESGELTKNGYWSDNGYYDNLLVSKTDDADAVYEGNYGIKFVSDGNWSGRAQFRATLEANTTYIASFMYKVDLNGSPNAPVVGFETYSKANPYDNDSWKTMPNYMGQADWITDEATGVFTPNPWAALINDGQWHQYFITFNTLDNVDFALRVMNSGDKSTICLDNLSIVKSNNLYVDGGFEKGDINIGNTTGHDVDAFDTNYGSPFTTENCIIDRADEPDGVYEGQKAFKWVSTNQWDSRMMWYADLEANTDYEVSFMYKVVGEVSPTIAMAHTPSFWSGDWKTMPNHMTQADWDNPETHDQVWAQLVTDGEWHQYKIVFNTKELTKDFCLYLMNDAWGERTTYIDNIYLSKRSESMLPRDDETTAVVSEFVTDKVNVSSSDKNLIGAGDRVLNFEAGADFHSMILEVPVKPDTDYMLSASFKGGYLSADNTPNAVFGLANPRSGLYLVTAPVMDGDKIVTYPFSAGMTTPCWDNDWHQRGQIFNSGDLETVYLMVSGRNTSLDLKDIVLCELADAVAPAAEKQPVAITDVTDTPSLEQGCKDSDNLLQNADLTKGTGYGTVASLTQDGLYLNGSRIGASYVLWMDVEPDTNYTFTVQMKGVKAGGNVIGLMDSNTADPQTVKEWKPEFDGEWHSYSVRFNSGEHKKLAFYAYDGGGEVFLRNFKLFETSKAIIENPKTGVDSVMTAAIPVVLGALCVSAMVFTLRRKQRSR